MFDISYAGGCINTNLHMRKADYYLNTFYGNT